MVAAKMSQTASPPTSPNSSSNSPATSSGNAKAKARGPGLGLIGLDATHFFVGNLSRARRFYQARMEFDEVAASTLDFAHRDGMESVVFQAGDARLMFSAPLSGSSRAGRYLRRHPDSACELILRVRDLDHTWNVLSERDATFVTDRIDTMTDTGPARYFVIATPLGDVNFTFLERPDGPFLPRGFTQTGQAKARHPLGITNVDHITSNLRVMRPWLDFLRDTCDFEQYWQVQFHTHDLRPDMAGGSGLRSIVMWDPRCGLKFANNEPLRPHFDKSQIAIFCADNRGPGIQHVALAIPDICKTVETLRQRSIQFLATPGSYYDALPARLRELKVPAVREPFERLRELGIQVDGSEEGYLLQIFMKDAALYFDDPAAGPFFLELIQREGSRSFGEGNFRALFEAIEREQAGQPWPAQ
jgi:4-hydroxyphenylpyruvate dioxygenase